MKTRSYLFALFCITLFSLGFSVFMIFNTNPYGSDVLTISMFFLSLFIFLTGILTLLGFYFRVKISNNEVFYANFYPAIRQAGLLSFVIIGLLVLNSLKVLTWWDAIMFALAILLLELYFQNKFIDNKHISQTNEK